MSRFPLSRSVGRVIRELRSRHDMSQEFLSSAAPVSRGHLSEIETGKSSPNLETIFRIARTFAMKASELIALAERKQRRVSGKSKRPGD